MGGAQTQTCFCSDASDAVAARVQLSVMDRRFRHEIYGLVNHGKYNEFLGVGTHLAQRCSYESWRPRDNPGHERGTRHNNMCMTA